MAFSAPSGFPYHGYDFNYAQRLHDQGERLRQEQAELAREQDILRRQCLTESGDRDRGLRRADRKGPEGREEKIPERGVVGLPSLTPPVVAPPFAQEFNPDFLNDLPAVATAAVLASPFLFGRGVQEAASASSQPTGPTRRRGAPFDSRSSQPSSIPFNVTPLAFGERPAFRNPLPSSLTIEEIPSSPPLPAANASAPIQAAINIPQQVVNAVTPAVQAVANIPRQVVNGAARGPSVANASQAVARNVAEAVRPVINAPQRIVDAISGALVPAPSRASVPVPSRALVPAPSRALVPSRPPRPAQPILSPNLPRSVISPALNVPASVFNDVFQRNPLNPLPVDNSRALVPRRPAVVQTQRQRQRLPTSQPTPQSRIISAQQLQSIREIAAQTGLTVDEVLARFDRFQELNAQSAQIPPDLLGSLPEQRQIPSPETPVPQLPGQNWAQNLPAIQGALAAVAMSGLLASAPVNPVNGGGSDKGKPLVPKQLYKPQVIPKLF
jgi:hypothetical protein